MTSIAIIAEEMGRNYCYLNWIDHPDWNNVYNSVRIDLNTHDVDGISIKDYIMAVAIVFNKNNNFNKGLSCFRVVV